MLDRLSSGHLSYNRLMKLLSHTKVSLEELKKMSQRMEYGIVKAVVDIENQIMVVDADMHADQEQMLLDAGSDQHYLWGINLIPANYGQPNFIEYDSMINLRPTQGNKSRGVDDPQIRTKIQEVVASLVSND